MKKFSVCAITDFLWSSPIQLLHGQSASSAQAGPTTPQKKPASPRDYIEVVATKIPEAPDDVPSALEVISGDDLRGRGATDLATALSLASGVEIGPGGDGGPASSVPEFWGLREFDAFLLVGRGTHRPFLGHPKSAVERYLDLCYSVPFERDRRGRAVARHHVRRDRRS